MSARRPWLLAPLPLLRCWPPAARKVAFCVYLAWHLEGASANQPSATARSQSRARQQTPEPGDTTKKWTPLSRQQRRATSYGLCHADLCLRLARPHPSISSHNAGNGKRAAQKAYVYVTASNTRTISADHFHFPNSTCCCLACCGMSFHLANVARMLV